MKKILFILFFVNLLQAEDVYATFDVRAEYEATLAFSSSGIVEKIYVKEGTQLKEGDVVASLENSDLKAMVERSKVALKYAKLDLDRQYQVKKYIDQARIDNYQKLYESAKAEYEYQNAMLEKSILKAPFDGTITSKIVEIGDVVSGQMITNAFKMASLDNIKLVLTFDSRHYGEVKKGSVFKYKIDGSEQEHTGKIDRIYPAVDSATNKITAEVKVKDFPVGLFGAGYIVVDTNGTK
ncbi:MAG: efflux RND transporter periplasmic adaptor subunit [Campylobacterales bacterium]|nr:efflux RND transporter periplasmic adaptor subunit [Campylobacterales bacterium]